MLPLPSSGQCHYTVAFSPDGRWLVAGGSAQAADVWDLQTPQLPARRLGGLDEPVVRVQFTPDGRLVTFGPTCHRLDDPTTWPPGVAFPTGGPLLAGGAEPNLQNGYLEVRDPATGRVIDTLPINPRPHRAAYSADGEIAATLAHGYLSVWNLRTRMPVVERSGQAHGGWLSLAFAPHGRRVVTGGIDSTVAVWDASTDGPPLKMFQWGVGPVYAVTFDRDGLRAAAAGHAGAIIWDTDE